MADILIIEDNQSVAASLKHVLEKKANCTVQTVGNGEAGLAEVQKRDFDVVLTDLEMPGMSGLEVVKQLHTTKPHLPVILMTAHHTTDRAIEAMKFGAYDYVVKPGGSIEQYDELIALVQEAAEAKRRTGRVEFAATTSDGRETCDHIIGTSKPMQEVLKEIGRVAETSDTVLIRGETGTGKELIARAIFSHSKRADRPFIVINCPALPANLLESELFGHEAGAFTDAKARRIGRFEQADGGTVLLDEIGDMEPNLQTKLLRFLQQKTFQRVGGREDITVDVRVLAATHRDLEQAIREGRFREDLYYRLNVAVIRLPPLRERLEDIPDFVKCFMRHCEQELHKTGLRFDPPAIALLQQQPWPGNVRELINVMRRALKQSGGYTITAKHIEEALAGSKPPSPLSGQSLSEYVGALLRRAMGGELDNVNSTLMGFVEQELYSQAIRLADGDQTKAAGWLGVSRPTMREKLTRYGLRATKGNP